MILYYYSYIHKDLRLLNCELILRINILRYKQPLRRLTMVTGYQPFINIGPGDIIKRDLEALSWTQDDLARIIGMSNKAINEIITNKTPINIEIAKLLSKSFGQSPQFWINADTQYCLRLRGDNKIDQ